MWQVLFKIPAAELVRGDIVHIKSGDKVPVMKYNMIENKLITTNFIKINRPMFA